jgi:hypothetical protein
MTTIEALNKIKAMFAEMPSEVATPQEPAAPEFKEYVLKDGTKVKIDKLEVGGSVVLVDEMGNETPAPVGEHELADGSKIVLSESGVIMEIKMPEVEEAPAEVEVEIEDEMAKKIQQLEAEVEDLKKKKKEEEMRVSAFESKFSKALSDLTDVIVGLANTPSATATETPKEKFNKHIESNKSKVERFLKLAQSIK